MKEEKMTIENKVKEIQRILVVDDRIPMSAAKDINDHLKIILLLANKEKK